MLVQDELTEDVCRPLYHFKLIIQQEDYWQLQAIVSGGSLYLLVKEVNVAHLITLLCIR